MSTNTKVGMRIAEIRKHKGLTQEYLTKRLDKTPQWLSNIERGTRPISANELIRLADILKVEPGIFFANDINKLLSMGSEKKPTGTAG